VLRWPRWGAVLTMVGAFVLGCSPEPHDGALVGQLRDRFPEHVDQVLGARGSMALVATAAGAFAPAPRGEPDPLQGAEAALAMRGALWASFPARGDGALRMALPDGFAFEVREVGLAGAGHLARGAVVYPHAAGAGASFWSATPAGYEEWLLVAPRAAGPVARWRVAGATLRQRGEAVDVLDAAGVRRVTVTAPAAWAEDGTPVRPRLAVDAHELALALDGAPATGLVLVDPAWRTVGTLATGRDSHTATLLPSGKVLIAGGSGSSPWLSSAELYDPARGTFTTTGPLVTGRESHSATLLPSGKVLLVGGFNTNGRIPNAELYDPGSGTFAATGALATPRDVHTATLLPSGKVLVVGGYGTAYLASAELYDPAAGAFAATGSLATARELHSATLLSSGQVLIAGGWDQTTLSSAELYDPATGNFAVTGSLVTARREHSATLLPSGKVYLAGGWVAGGLSSAELYDPTSGTFALTGGLAAGRSGHGAALLPSGKVLLAGGWSGAALASTELYDPTAGTSTPAGALATGRSSHSTTLLPSGKVLVVGGYDGSTRLASAEDLDLPSFYTATGSLATGREYHTATLLPSGEVLVVGGTGVAGVGTTAALFDPALGTFTPTGSPASGRYEHTATLLSTGKVLVVGGSTSPATAELYDPTPGTFSVTGPPLAAHSGHTATLLASGKVLVAGGSGNTTAAELYDPAPGSFTATGALGTGRGLHTATLLPSGKVLVAGGQTGAGVALGSAETYNPVTGTFSFATTLGYSRQGHTATMLPTGEILVVGGGATGAFRTQIELYNPTTGHFSTKGQLASARRGHTATLLPSGNVLVYGGLASQYAATAELYDLGLGGVKNAGTIPNGGVTNHTATLLPSGRVLLAGGHETASYPTAARLFDEGRQSQPAWTPTFTVSGPLHPGQSVSISGTLLTGVSEASSGGCGSSATNLPFVLAMRLDNGPLGVCPATGWTATAATVTVPPAAMPGPYLAWVVVNGVLSDGQPIAIETVADASACSASAACASGSCVDNVCCATACSGVCQACSAAHKGSGVDGVCGFVAANTDPHAECLGGWTCDGNGACRTSCSSDAECDTGYYCTMTTGGACVFRGSISDVCSGDSVDPTGNHRCTSGFCADGRCCDSACDATCYACNVAGQLGTCSPLPAGSSDVVAAEPCNGTCDGAGGCVRGVGAACSDDAQCGTGYCTDGVCCTVPCHELCFQCNAPGNLGLCAQVPDGTDPRGECGAMLDGGSGLCGQASCRAHQCAFTPAWTSCGTCSACDGQGQCAAAPTDDEACGEIDCSGLDTACRSYAALSLNRCAGLGECRAANTPATCTEWTDHACDGGDGGGDGGGGCGCAAAPEPPHLALALLLLLVLPRTRRRR
jgi:MYXO-CTERM domain-containing protein